MPVDYAIAADGSLILSPEYADSNGYSLAWSGGYIEHSFNDLNSNDSSRRSPLLAEAATRFDLYYTETTQSGQTTVLQTKTFAAFGAGYYNFYDFTVMNGVAEVKSPYGSGGSGTVFGSEGDDLLIGGGHDDTLYGFNGNDRLRGGKGSDFLDGSGGADRMQGGAGEDLFILRRGEIGTRASGMDHIIDFEGAGTDGGDLIRFDGFNSNTAFISYIGTFNGIQRYSVGDATNKEEFMLQSTNSAHLTIDDVLFYNSSGQEFVAFTEAFFRPLEYDLY